MTDKNIIEILHAADAQARAQHPRDLDRPGPEQYASPAVRNQIMQSDYLDKLAISMNQMHVLEFSQLCEELAQHFLKQVDKPDVTGQDVARAIHNWIKDRANV